AAFFKDGDAVSGACQLLGAGQSGRARADDSHFFASAELRRLGAYPAFLPAAFDNGVLNRFDTDRIIVDVQRTGSFARCRADASGEFRKVVGGVQGIQCRLPLLLVNQVVPVRDQVVDRTAV